MKESEDEGPLEADWEDRLTAFREAQEQANAALTLREDIQMALTVIGRRSAHQRRLEAEANENETGFVFDLPCPNPDLPEDSHDPAALKAYKAALEAWQAPLKTYKGYRLDLRNADLRRADLMGLNLCGARFANSEMQGADLGMAQLQGADLRGAQLQGADLRGAMDASTSMSAATLRGAALMEVDYTTIPQITEHLSGMFGDGSVTLPEGVDRPAHWPRHSLDFDIAKPEDSEFYIEWRKWQADPEGYTPPEAPE